VKASMTGWHGYWMACDAGGVITRAGRPMRRSLWSAESPSSQMTPSQMAFRSSRQTSRFVLPIPPDCGRRAASSDQMVFQALDGMSQFQRDCAPHV
jgi:hypothetical protein